jgi:hypothetical protein
LSEQSGALVISAPRPHLTAAVGAALRAAHGPGAGATALAPTALGSVSDATMMSEVPIEPAVAPALAWSEADDDSGIMPLRAGEYDDVPPGGPTSSRPQAGVDVADEPDVFGATGDAWYRRPLMVAVGTALAVLAIGAGVLITLRHTSGSAPSTPLPSVSTTPEPSVPASSETTASQEPTTNAPTSSVSDTSTAAPTTSQTPTTTTTTEAPTTATTQPPTTTPSPQSPDKPRFPRRPGDRLFPEPGLGGR